MNIRDKRQEEFANCYIKSNGKGILYLAPRFGKCRVSIIIFKKAFIKKYPTVLIAYPDNKIKESWEAEFKEMNYINPNITYTTHLSLKKHIGIVYDIVVIDEIHLLSEAQIGVGKRIIDENENVLALTGTMNEWTEKQLTRRLHLPVIARYPIEQAIEEGVIVDYQITVKIIPLDNRVAQTFGKKIRTEKAQFRAYSYIIDKLEEEEKDTFHLRLARMRVIQNSLAKLNATKTLLQQFKDKRVLIFCGVTKIADGLGCLVHHSKSDNSEEFEKFASGEGNHCAVVKIGNTGVTYKPLNIVIINYFSSSEEDLVQKIMRCMGLEYDSEQKKANIYIISTNEEVELKWLKRALSSLDSSKIKWE